MSELYEALEQEQSNAAAYLKAALEVSEIEAAYWLGYLEGSTNAAALVYGPTPLEVEAN